MEIEIIDGHSVAVNLLTKGPVLDAGARGFAFSKRMAELGCETFACDPSPDIEQKPACVIHWDNRALVSKKCPPMMSLEMGPDPNGWYVCWDGTLNGSFPVYTMTLDSYKLPVPWDVIKLNIEGSEYDILDEIEGPIARQIVFGMHEHTQAARGRQECDRIIDKLRQWYVIHNQVWEKRYGCIESYWAILAIRKDLA